MISSKVGVLGFSAGTLAHVQPGNLELGLCRGQFRPGALGPKVAEQAEAATGPDPAYVPGFDLLYIHYLGTDVTRRRYVPLP